MSAIDTRTVKRDSLFLTADVQLAGHAGAVRVKVRNLSDGGMMAEANLPAERGMRLNVTLRNVGNIGGSVAWTQDNRFGIVFDKEIDARKVRAPTGEGEHSPRYTRPSTIAPQGAAGVSSLRKI